MTAVRVKVRDSLYPAGSLCSGICVGPSVQARKQTRHFLVYMAEQDWNPVWGISLCCTSGLGVGGHKHPESGRAPTCPAWAHLSSLPPPVQPGPTHLAWGHVYGHPGFPVLGGDLTVSQSRHLVPWTVIAHWAGRSLAGCPDYLPVEPQPCMAIGLVPTPLLHPHPTGYPESDMSCHLRYLAASALPVNTLQPGVRGGPGLPPLSTARDPWGLPSPHHLSDLQSWPRAGPQLMLCPHPPLAFSSARSPSGHLPRTCLLVKAGAPGP